jgi:DNA-binding IclR family transcriptional regulator
MQFDFKKPIGGLRAVKIRTLLNHTLRQDSFGADHAAHELKISLPNASVLLRTIEEEGYIEPANGRGRWQLTDLGRRFANARAIPRIPRRKADAIVKALLTTFVANQPDSRASWRR